MKDMIHPWTPYEQNRKINPTDNLSHASSIQVIFHSSCYLNPFMPSWHLLKGVFSKILFMSLLV